jgi:transcription initiation factor TFIIIB Brf1 subunit/transcription initiation factor TFIIB
MHYVFKVGNTIQMTEKTKKRMIELVDLINRKDEHVYTSGKDPMGLAETALLVASANNGENRTQREVACATGLTAVTKRRRLKEIGKSLEALSN